MIGRRPSLVFLGITLLLGLAEESGLAQEKTIGALLVTDDHDNNITETLGVTLYRAFLEQGPYQEIISIAGYEEGNVYESIRTLASRYDLVDVFFSVHTTDRSPEEVMKQIPSPMRKLRLVYSTACGGASAERKGWEAVGARAVITHVGGNNPSVFFPYFLSRWIEGAALEDVVTGGYRETVLFNRFFRSVPFGPEHAFDEPDCQPVLSGDRHLTIQSDGVPAVQVKGSGLKYGRRTGSVAGLVLRAMVGRPGLDQQDIDRWAQGTLLPDQVESVLKDLRGIQAEYDPGEDRADLVVRLDEPMEAPIERSFGKGIRVTLEFRLGLDSEVRIGFGQVDPVQRRVTIHVSGIWIQAATLPRLTLRKLQLDPYPLGLGYRLSLWGNSAGGRPIHLSIPIGGKAHDLSKMPKPLFISAHQRD
jgi:hypothetical protein